MRSLRFAYPTLACLVFLVSATVPGLAHAQEVGEGSPVWTDENEGVCLDSGSVSGTKCSASPGTGDDVWIPWIATPDNPVDVDAVGSEVDNGLQGAAASAQCNGKPANIVGTSGDDYLQGGPGNDVIAGLGGSDTIKGEGGGDTLCGGDAFDIIHGGSGIDYIFGNGGGDSLMGEVAADYIDGNGGNDSISGGPGGDGLRGQDGNDALFDGLQLDTLSGGNGNDFWYACRSDGEKDVPSEIEGSTWVDDCS
jgi:Ca2+-binding RTX toxin-like protein